MDVHGNGSARGFILFVVKKPLGSSARAFAHEGTTPLSNTFNLNSVGTKAAGVEIALCTDSVETAFVTALEASAEKIVDPILKPWGRTVA